MNSLKTNSVSKLLLSETWIEIRACPRWKDIKATNLGAVFNWLILLYQLFEGENIPVIQNFEIPLPLGKKQAFDYHLYLGSTQEFDLCRGGVGNLNQKCQVSLCLLSDRNKIP